MSASNDPFDDFQIVGAKSDQKDDTAGNGDKSDIVIPTADEIMSYGQGSEGAELVPMVFDNIGAEDAKESAEGLAKRVSRGTANIANAARHAEEADLSNYGMVNGEFRHTKVEESKDVSANLLKGRMGSYTAYARRKGEKAPRIRTGTTLSVEVDYKKLWLLNPNTAKKAEDDFDLEYAQKRACVIHVGTFKDEAAAADYLQTLDRYMMHVLAEEGAEASRLSIAGNDFGLESDDKEGVSEQTFSDALSKARLMSVFGKMAKGDPLSHAEAYGVIVKSLIEDLSLPHHLIIGEPDSHDRRAISVLFDTEKMDCGDAHFHDPGHAEPGRMSFVVYDNGSLNNPRDLYKGPLEDGRKLQEIFIDRVVDAAREAELISDEQHDSYSGQITSVSGIPMSSSKLGKFSPFGS